MLGNIFTRGLITSKYATSAYVSECDVDSTMNLHTSDKLHCPIWNHRMALWIIIIHGKRKSYDMKISRKILSRIWASCKVHQVTSCFPILATVNNRQQSGFSFAVWLLLVTLTDESVDIKVCASSAEFSIVLSS